MQTFTNMELEEQGKETRPCDHDNKKSFFQQHILSKAYAISISVLTLVLVIILIVFLAYTWDQIRANRDSTQGGEVESPSSMIKKPVISRVILGVSTDTLQMFEETAQIQKSDAGYTCETDAKKTFHDIDYALLGYNVLKGYPLAPGHDPGFTYPIFLADYSSGGHTADCRFRVPLGLVVIPAISCVTSFSSEVIQTRYELQKTLSKSAKAGGRGWGFKFSASRGYKSTMKEIKSGESVYIISSAKCNYYLSKVIHNKAPSFHPAFLNWVEKLDKEADETVYFDFFDMYGTHFPSEVLFGARFSYEYKMDSKTYDLEKTNGVNVGKSAGFSGLFKIGGGKKLDTSQQEAVHEFNKKVTTKTIAVGAPPPSDADPIAWTTSIKENPVPSSYELSPIMNLFTEQYMGHLGFKFENIAANIERFKHPYCLHLKTNGNLDTCEEFTPGVDLENTRLLNPYRSEILNYDQCVESCLQRVECAATSYCNTDGQFKRTCAMFKSSNSPPMVPYGREDTDWKTNVYLQKINNTLEFQNTNINGTARAFTNASSSNSTQEQCNMLCEKDVYCVAYTYCSCPTSSLKCQLYSKYNIDSLTNQTGTHTYFMEAYN